MPSSADLHKEKIAKINYTHTSKDNQILIASFFNGSRTTKKAVWTTGKQSTQPTDEPNITRECPALVIVS